MDHNLNYHREDSLRKYHVLRQSPTLRGPAAIFLDAQDLTLHLQLHEQTLHEANVQVQCESFHRITDAIKWAVDWDAYDNITGRRNSTQEKAARNPNHPMHFTDDEVAETNSSKKANRVRSPLEKNHPLMTYLIRPDILERLRVGAKHQLEAYSSTQVEMGRFGGATIEAFEEKLLKMQLVQEQVRICLSASQSSMIVRIMSLICLPYLSPLLLSFFLGSKIPGGIPSNGRNKLQHHSKDIPRTM